MVKSKKAPKKFVGRMDQVGRFYVETWWDRRSKNWITEIKEEADGIDVRGGADYSGHHTDARAMHEDAMLTASRMQ
jgi:hypothetical protein